MYHSYHSSFARGDRRDAPIRRRRSRSRSRTPPPPRSPSHSRAFAFAFAFAFATRFVVFFDHRASSRDRTRARVTSELELFALASSRARLGSAQVISDDATRVRRARVDGSATTGILRARSIAPVVRRARAMEAFVRKRAREPRTSARASSTFVGVDDSLLIHDDERCAPRARIAGFDLDETLERTKSGAKAYSAKAGDFVFLNAHVKRVVKTLHDDGYKICIFSNQGMVRGALNGVKARDLSKRLNDLSAALDVPFQAFLATQINKPGYANDPHEYRKGGTGMWKRMVRCHNGGIVPDLATCFFVGDAAGRASDHGAGDKEFAEGVGIKFFVPEDIFRDGNNWT